VDRYSSGTHSTELFADAAIDFVDDAAGDDRPFFCYLATMEPHDPRTPPGDFLSRYDHEAIDLPENFARQHPFGNGALDIRDENLAARPRDPAEIRRHVADYYASVTHLDHHLGRVLDALAACGEREDTIVAVTADHGLAVGQHGLMGKQNLYDHSVRVPLLLAGPGVLTDVRRDALCHQYDLNPTLRDLTGLPTPAGVDARSLVPAMEGTDGPYDAVHAAYKDVQRMVRGDRYKLIEYGGDADRRTQLFDLADDPGETENLADDPAHADHLERLRSRLVEWSQPLDGGAGWIDTL
jgi:arylsulfatase A-like enzyme